MSGHRSARIKAEYNGIAEARDLGQIDPAIIELGPTRNPDKTLNYDKWVLRFEGRKGTDLEKGKYTVEIEFPESYPGKFPQLKFINDFQHYHVFAGGSICMALLSIAGWNSGASMLQLATSLINMVHSDPNVGDQANKSLAQLYQNSKEEYRNFMRKQAERLSKAW